VVATTVFALVYVWIVWLIDRHEKEPLPVLGTAFVGGLLAAPVLTALIEAVSGVPNSLSPASFGSLPLAEPNLAGAIVEESAKALVVWMAFKLLPREFDGALDGIVYGAVVGAGFNLAECLLYFWSMVPFVGTASFSVAFLGDLFVSGLTHCLFTATFGALLGYTREAGWDSPWPAMLGWAAASLYHVGFVGLGYLATGVLDQPAIATLAAGGRWLLEFGGVVLLAAAAAWAWVRERRVLRAQLADEAGAGIVTGQELDALLAGRRLAAQFEAFQRTGMSGCRRVRRLHHAQAELAFAKHRAQRGLGSVNEVEECRTRIRQLRVGSRP
jgi:RsiW-degrading membrane proteinase PrsW (M82 family)